MKRRRWFELHSWLGIMSGLLLFVICWSGTVAVLSHEIDWLLNPVLRVEARGESASWGRIEAAVRAAHPQAQVRALHAPLYANFAAEVGIDMPGQDNLRVYVDPYTAEVRGLGSFFNVQRFFRSFHMSLFDVFGIGYWLVSAFGFFLLASLIAPLVFYQRWWQRFLTLKTGRGARVFWSEAHKLIGLWAWWFALLMALTGAWWTFEYADLKLGYPEHTPAAPSGLPAPLPLDTLIARAQQVWPQLEIRTIYLPEDPQRDALSLHGQNEAWLVRDRANRLALDPGTGEVLAQQTAQGLGWPARWIDTVDPLHFGDFAGLGVKLIWFVFGLGVSGLCLSGAWLHAQRLQRETAARSRWAGTGAALVVSALVLLASAHAGWHEIKGYGPLIDDVQRWPSVSAPVSGFLAAWVLATLAMLILWSRWLWRPGHRARTRSGSLEAPPPRTHRTLVDLHERPRS